MLAARLRQMQLSARTNAPCTSFAPFGPTSMRKAPRCDAISDKVAYRSPIFSSYEDKPPSADLEPLRSPSASGAKTCTTPSPEHLNIWQTADAVCFDVDCTCVINDGLDILAEYMGVGPQIEAITNKAMDGTMGMEEALAERLRIINCTPADVNAFLAKNPPQNRLVPGIVKLIATLQERGTHVYLISGGFREILVPIANHLGVPLENVMANRMNWQWDDATSMPTKLVGFDLTEPTAYNKGKPEAISRLRASFPAYKSVVMVGDGITDLEAVQVSGGADLFIGFGGVIAREAVMAGAHWFVYKFDEMTDALNQDKLN